MFANSLVQKKSRVVQKSVKLLEMMLLSAGLISTVAMVKGAVVPYSCEIVVSSLVGFWNSIRCFLSSPLYICIIINFTVMLIAVSSTFNHQETGSQDDEINVCVDMDIVEAPPRRSTISPNPIKGSSNLDASPHSNCVEQTPIDKFVVTKLSESKKATYSLSESMKEKNVARTKGKVKEDEVMMSSDERENDEEDTMEATWKAITGGEKQRTKKKELKKSGTWDVPPRTSVHRMERLDSEEVMPTTPKWRDLRKSETFNDAVSITLRGGLRRDPSISLEEFNKQVEAFIKKFKMKAR